MLTQTRRYKPWNPVGGLGLFAAALSMTLTITAFALPSGGIAAAAPGDLGLEVAVAQTAAHYRHWRDGRTDLGLADFMEPAVEDPTAARDDSRPRFGADFNQRPRRLPTTAATVARATATAAPTPAPTPVPTPEPTPVPTPAPAPVDPVSRAVEWWTAYLGYVPEALLAQPVEFSAWPSYGPCQGVSPTGCTSWPERDYVWVNNTFGSDMTAMVAHEFGHVLGYEDNATGPAIMQYANWNNAPYDCWWGVDQHC